eukprot:COSAG05_NODE_12_length_37297_cov_117.537072_33_plen_68_part_00
METHPYKGAYSELQFLHDNRRKQQAQGCVSNLWPAPRFEPERRHWHSIMCTMVVQLADRDMGVECWA